MTDFEARRIVEALRSGVSSRAAGQYFSSARPNLTREIEGRIKTVGNTKEADGMIITGRYGEGKTHLLNTVFNMAQANNMAVSFISLSKETPFNQLHLVYQKLLQNTYLPNRLQPGFLDLLTDITPKHPLAGELQAYTAKRLNTDKLFYLLRAYLSTDDADEKFMLMADLEGDFIGAAALKKIYRRIFNEKVTYNASFSKTKHMDDYFSAISYMFRLLGYSGWVMLFDETELIGRLGKKSRLKAYKNMASFLFPGEFSNLSSAFCLFTMTSQYIEDVVDGKFERANLEEADIEQNDRKAAEKTLDAITKAKQLNPLTKDEITQVMVSLLDIYKRAYDWNTDIDMREVMKAARIFDDRNTLLRTRIRAAVECLDQLYQYNKVADIRINELGQASYEEDIPELVFEE